MKLLRICTTALALGVTALSAAPSEAVAYPIDCAIFLCMAGGFPPSTECAAAKAEVIRRITPWPVEPPLQLWRCPMRVDAATAARIGLAQELGSDGLPEEVRQYRDAVEIYHIQGYARMRTQDGKERVVDNTQLGSYRPTGDFTWDRSSFEKGPSWLAEAVGGRRVDVKKCVSWGRGNDCRHEVVGQENRAGGGIGTRIRGVAFRYVDHEGGQHTEFVRY